jgi:hypothetical protein
MGSRSIRPLGAAPPLAVAVALALLAGPAAAQVSSSTNQTLEQVLGTRQVLPVPTDPNIGLREDRAYREQLRQLDVQKRAAASARRQQVIEGSGAALQQMRQRDLEAARQQQEEFQKEQIEGQELKFFQLQHGTGR